MRNKIYQWVWTEIHAAVFFQDFWRFKGHNDTLELNLGGKSIFRGSDSKHSITKSFVCVHVLGGKPFFVHKLFRDLR